MTIRVFVVCRDMQQFQDWRERSGFAVDSRDCLALCTDAPGAADRVRGRRIFDPDQVVRVGDYAEGTYWHDIEDELAMAAQGLDIGDPRRQQSSN